MKVCPDCHKIYRKDEEFCPKCGCRFDAYVAANGNPETQAVRDTAHRMVRGKYRAHTSRNIVALLLALILVLGMFYIVGSEWNKTTLTVEVGSASGSGTEYVVYADGVEIGSGWTSSTTYVNHHFAWGLWEPTKTVAVLVDYGTVEKTGQAQLVNERPESISLLK